MILRGAHFLYRYDGTSWSQVDASCFSDYQKIYNQEAYNLNQPRDPGDAVVILSDGTVWQNKYHWGGTQWLENGVEFNSFYRVSDQKIYAGSDEGLYQYNGTAWSKVETADISGSIEVASGNADGELLLMAGKNNYDPYLWDGSSATKLSLDGLYFNNKNTFHNYLFFGLDQDGIPMRLSTVRAKDGTISRATVMTAATSISGTVRSGSIRLWPTSTTPMRIPTT